MKNGRAELRRACLSTRFILTSIDGLIGVEQSFQITVFFDEKNGSCREHGCSAAAAGPDTESF
jgi:hypothetical protein